MGSLIFDFIIILIVVFSILQTAEVEEAATVVDGRISLPGQADILGLLVGKEEWKVDGNSPIQSLVFKVDKNHPAHS